MAYFCDLDLNFGSPYAAYLLYWVIAPCVLASQRSGLYII